MQEYLEYVGRSEAPTIYHRWTCVSILGAITGRNVSLPFGHGVIYPNQYIMLMGSPGTRKGTAMNIGKRLLKEAGYTRFAPDKMSKERFLMEMKPYTEDELDGDLELLNFDQASEIYAFAEEFTDLVGHGGMEFMTMLTKLWDNHDKYEHPKIHGKSVVVDKPTVNIFGGNTAQGLLLAIPPEALGNGFMSRMIFVYSEPTNVKITFPVPPSATLKESLVEQLKEMRLLTGNFSLTQEATEIFDRIYREFQDINDPRFRHYSTRRFTHVLKIAMLFALSRLSLTITTEDALQANTLLHYTELRMPKALGEFGKSKYSDVSHAVLEHLSKLTKPASLNDLWKLVAKDLNKITELADVMKNLKEAGKVQIITIKGKQGYMPCHQESHTWDPSLLVENFLSPEEML